MDSIVKTTPSGYAFEEDLHEVSSYQELIVSIYGAMYAMDLNILDHLCDGGTQKQLYSKKLIFLGIMRLSSNANSGFGFIVETNLGDKEILESIESLLQYYGFDDDRFRLYILNENSKHESHQHVPALRESSLKIGEFIHTAMSKLSKSGFRFSEAKINQMSSVEWGKSQMAMQAGNVSFIKKVITCETEERTYTGQTRMYSDKLNFCNAIVYLSQEWKDNGKICWYCTLSILDQASTQRGRHGDQELYDRIPWKCSNCQFSH